MGPKKKKVNKLAKMSEEEKLRYLQHRAAIEEEQRRRKQQLISTFMKNKLKHEEAFTRLNRAKINQQWRQILRQIKCKELRDIAETMRQTFEAALTAKDNIIETLVSNLVESSNQRAVAMKSHLEAVETLIGFHEDRLQRIKDEYNEERNKMLDKADEDLEEIALSTNSKTEYLKKTFQKTEVSCNKRLVKLKHATSAKRFKLKYEIEEEISQMEEGGNLAIATLWEMMKKVFENYKNFLKKLEPDYIRYSNLDANYRKQYKEKNATIIFYNESLKRMKKESSRKSEMYERQKAQLQEAIKERAGYLRILRGSIMNDKNKDEQQILSLTKMSNNLQQKLESQLKKVELMIFLLKKCESLYSEKESALMILKPKSAATNEDEVSEVSVLWKRLGIIKLENNCLQEQLASNNSEIERLKLVLKQVLNSIARPPSFPKSANK